MTINYKEVPCWVIGLPSGTELVLKESDTSKVFDDLAQEWHIALVSGGSGTMNIDEARFYEPNLRLSDMRRARDLTLNVNQITYMRKAML